MRTPLVILYVVIALVIGIVAGFLYAGSQSGRALLNQTSPAPVAPAPQSTTEAPSANPFEAAPVNPLENAGYDNPLENVEFNPFAE